MEAQELFDQFGFSSQIANHSLGVSGFLVCNEFLYIVLSVKFAHGKAKGKYKYLECSAGCLYNCRKWHKKVKEQFGIPADREKKIMDSISTSSCIESPALQEHKNLFNYKTWILSLISSIAVAGCPCFTFKVSSDWKFWGSRLERLKAEQTIKTINCWHCWQKVSFLLFLESEMHEESDN